MTMTLNVISGTPRLFEVKNFFSEPDVDHILDLAISSSEEISPGKGRAALFRQDSSIMDAIYSHVADLLRVEEGIFVKNFVSAFRNLETMNVEHLLLRIIMTRLKVLISVLAFK